MYGSPMVDLKWHETMSTSKRHVISADHRVVRIWDPQSGNIMTNVEPTVGEINDVCIIRNSGLMFMALDSPQISSYFIPSLGPAPRWISYLENLTEELEEGGQSTIYEDFKFVTKEDLEKLNLTNLIGTNLLHAYMHGFFMDHRLYSKAKSMADPFAYEAYRQRRIQEKLDAERAARITIKRKLPKVNKELAASLLAAAEDDENGDHWEGFASIKEGKAKKNKKKMGTDLLKDDRFAAMFSDEAFEVDEESPEYKALHPNVEKSKASLVLEHFDLVHAGDSDQSNREESSTDVLSSEDELPISKRKRNKSGKVSSAVPASVPRLYEVKDEMHAQAFRNRVPLSAEHTLPLEERILLVEKNNSGHLTHQKKVNGTRELSFVSRSEQENDRGRKKRGVQSLGLKSGRPKFRGRAVGRSKSTKKH
eukprot:c25719_g1_i1 orf=861-2126(+)